jgi:RNA polymerase sigma-70 factor, ECF subfamily
MGGRGRAFRGEAGLTTAGVAPRGGGALEKMLASLYARGRRAYPRIVVAEQVFGGHLARCTNDGKAASLADLPVEDLYLACACAARVRGAATAFERKFGPVIRRAISRVLRAPDERQEAEQRAWQRIFVEDEHGGPPRITQYLGQGRLESWVAVASMRIAVSFGRAESTERRLRAKIITDTADVGPESQSMKGELRRAFETAVTEAIGRLKPRERMILRLHVVSGMTLEAISKSLGVTRQAVSKTFSQSRARILDEVETSLKQRLGIPPEDLSSVLRLVASRFDVSVSRVLGKGA